MSEDPADVASLSLPPGSMGWPLVGESLAMVRNPYAFLETRRRAHGNVFKSNVLGRKVVFVSGPEAVTAFLDPRNVTRERAHPDHVRELFGGINMNMFDGPRHFALKSMAIEGFDLAAIERYLPDIQTLVRTTLGRLAGAGRFRAVDELKRTAIELICRNIVSLLPGPLTDALHRDYGLVMEGMMNVPVPLPGTKFSRARAARDRIFTVFRAQIAQHRATPMTDGLGRMLAARAADGKTYTDDEALLELHHIIIAGYIVYAMLAELLLRMDGMPELKTNLRLEARAFGDGPLSVERLATLRAAGHAVLEAKRRTPILPLVFGKAARSFAVGGHLIPAGWDVYLAVASSNMDPAVFALPDRFDVTRYDDDRAEHRKHEHAFIPQGGGPPTGHKCLGADYSTFVSLVFLVELLQSYDWQVPAQDLALRWNATPPEPRDGLQIILTRAA